jgi:hypothetical protein
VFIVLTSQPESTQLAKPATPAKLDTAFGLGEASTDREACSDLLDVLDGGYAEESFELSTELRGTLVTDGTSGLASIIAADGHESPGPVKSDAFEVLERGTSRNEFEVVVENRDAHTRPLRKFVSSERLGIIRMDMLQNPGNPREMVVATGQRM